MRYEAEEHNVKIGSKFLIAVLSSQFYPRSFILTVLSSQFYPRSFILAVLSSQFYPRSFILAVLYNCIGMIWLRW